MRKIQLTVLLFLFVYGCATTGEQHGFNNALMEEQMQIPKVQLNEFIVGPGDSIEIQVWRHPDLTRAIEVQSNGFIAYPLLGDVKVAGMNLTELQQLITQHLSEYIVNPQVTIQVRLPKSQKVFVLGEVRRPGVYLLDNSMTALEAIAQAGGFTLDAKKAKVFLIRQKQGKASEPVFLDIDSTLKGKDIEQNVSLQRGDILYVPPSNLAQTDRFFRHLAIALGPIVTLEQGIVLYPQVENVVTGKETSGITTVAPVVVITPTSP
ncbi:MAG: polysaccharide export protein [Nitrospirae bacterium]|nr:polysaccharide export protein [Nitrospirota bacterium]